MSSVITVRSLGLGVLSWLVPFAASVLFFDRSGQLMIAEPLFKSIMIVLFGGLGVALLVLAFRKIPTTAMTGLGLGSLWLVINLVLDLAVLLPLSGMTITHYVQDIGLRYLLMPVIALGMGLAANAARNHSNGP